MIDWYHMNPGLRASDQEIDDLFKRDIAKLVMVIVEILTHDKTPSGYSQTRSIPSRKSKNTLLALQDVALCTFSRTGHLRHARHPSTREAEVIVGVGHLLWDIRAT